MARKSVKEILEAARKGGPAGPAAGGPAAAGVDPPQEEAPSVEAASSAPSPPPRPAPSPPPPAGRPLTLKEKLAAARAGAAPAAAPAKPAAPGPAPEAEPAPEAPAAGPAPAPAPLGRPLTLQEKLAAARAKGGPAAPAAAQPAAAKPAAAKAAPAKTAPRALPPLAEISDPKDLAEALRQAGTKHTAGVAAAAKAKEPPPKPAREKAAPASVLPRPSKAAALAAPEGPSAEAAPVGRRRFLAISTLSLLWVAWGSFVAGLTAFTVMLGRFMFPNVLAEPPSTIKIGVKDNYDPEAVNENFKAEWGFWVVRSTRVTGEDIIYALQSVCTHLGCPPNWLEGEQKFKCPCHGSGFYISGINFEGPAPRPLERFKVTLADDGQIVVDKSQKFQQELGQWSDPDSFVSVV